MSIIHSITNSQAGTVQLQSTDTHSVSPLSLHAQTSLQIKEGLLLQVLEALHSLVSDAATTQRLARRHHWKQQRQQQEQLYQQALPAHNPQLMVDPPLQEATCCGRWCLQQCSRVSRTLIRCMGTCSVCCTLSTAISSGASGRHSVESNVQPKQRAAGVLCVWMSDEWTNLCCGQDQSCCLVF